MVSEDQQQILDIKIKYEDALYGIIRYKEKIDDLKAAIKDLKKQEEDKTITTNELKVQTEAINATIKEYQYNVRALQKEIQNNVRQQKEQDGSLKQLRAELSNATKAFDELSRAEREGAKGKELQKHINDITKELKNAEEATQRYYRNVGNYEGAINNAIFGNSQFGQSLKAIVDMAGDGGFSGIMKTAKLNAQAFGTTIMSLVKNPYFAALAGVAGAGMAFKWFFDYNMSILEATRLTREFTGYTGEALETMRNNIQATADAMGKDFKDVLSTADVLMSNFHVSGEEAMKIINDGFASGADLSGDMLQKMQKYAPTFHDAGIEADELVAILQQTRSGIFSDKGLDIIEMASKKIREMNSGTASALDAIGISSKKVQEDLKNGSTTTFKVIQQVATKMKSFGADSKEVGTVLKDVFGKQGAAAGLQLIEQLDTMTTDINEVKEQTGAWGKTQEENIKVHRELNSYLSSMFDMSQKGFGSIIAQGKLLGEKTLVKIVKSAHDCYNAFADWYNESILLRGIIQGYGVLMKSTWTTVKLVANLIVNAFKYMGRAGKGFLDILEGIVTFDLAKAKTGFSEIFNLSLLRDNIKDAEKAGAEYGQAFSDGFANTAKSRIKRLKLANVDGGATSKEPTNDTTNNNDKSGGSSTTSKSGKSGKSGKTTSRVDAAKLEAERIKQIEKQLQADIAKVQFEYNEKVMDAKRKYLAGMFKDENEYKDALNNLEKEMITNSLNVYVEAGSIGADKAQEMEEKLIDFMIQAKETLKQRAKEIVDAIDKEFEEAEKKRKEEDIMSGGTGEDEDNTAKLQRYQEFLSQRIGMYSDYADVHEALSQKMHDTDVELMKDANKKQQQEATAMQTYELAMINALGDGLQSFFDSEELTFHNFLKTMLIEFLNATEAQMSASYVKILAEDLTRESFAGIATAAAKLALIKTAFAAAKAMVKGFSVGGYVQGSGSGTSDSIPARLSNGESVMTAKATSMFSPILSAFNQLGGGVPIVVNNGQSQIGMDMLAAAVAKGYMMAPRPVVSVEEINQKQKRVQTRENIGRL